ncbi:hypothetical protein GCM10009304_24280 [Pseudomonas matsuisoli]|uniref:Uncharacterized protein n=1 Tax=Pseudomonas matsuisoli TaxID=1515666 RepID=A0A917PXH1_9PSED|nr:hypothetical protein GCM10009304_24280 [Pseudomonas matsuisoli]
MSDLTGAGRFTERGSSLGKDGAQYNDRYMAGKAGGTHELHGVPA